MFEIEAVGCETKSVGPKNVPKSMLTSSILKVTTVSFWFQSFELIK